MREKYLKDDSDHEIINTDLIRKISNGETPETLIITGDVDFGFFADNQDLFATTLLGACLKNRTTKTIIFDDLSLDAIHCLLPVLATLNKIDKLLLRNLSVDRVSHICTELAEHLATAPEMILDDLVTHKKSYAIVDNFNKQKTDYLRAQNPKKRELGHDGKNETSNKKIRLDNAMAIENQNLAPIGLPQDVHEKKIGISDAHIETLRKIQQNYLESSPNFTDEKKVIHAKNVHQKQFIDFITKDNSSVEEYMKFIPWLDKITRSPIFALKSDALVLAAEKGKLHKVRFLLGGQVRKIHGSPTPENKKAVEDGSELLIIKKKYPKGTKKLLNQPPYLLAFKNKNGFYEEQGFKHSLLDNANFHSTGLHHAQIINFAIKYARQEGTYPNWLLHTTPGISAQSIYSAFQVAIHNGDLSIVYVLMEHIHLHLTKHQPQMMIQENAGEEDAYLFALLSSLGCFAIQHNNINLLSSLIKIQSDCLNEEMLFHAAIKNQNINALDLLYRTYFNSDQEITAHFKLLPPGSEALLNYYLSDANDFSHSIATQEQSYEILIPQTPEEYYQLKEKVLHDAETSILLITNDEYTLGLSSDQSYQEHRITGEYNHALIKKIVAEQCNGNSVKTSGWATRHLRQLLLSLEVHTPHQYDPEALIDVIERSYDWKKIIELLLQNKYFDLSINDNDLIKRLTQEHIKWIKYQENPHSFTTYMSSSRSYNILNILITLLMDRCINKASAEVHMDDYSQAVKFVIEKGYAETLPFLIQRKQQAASSLALIFRMYPQIMNEALDTGMKESAGGILDPLLQHLQLLGFALPTQNSMQELYKQLEDIQEQEKQVQTSSIEMDALTKNKQMTQSRLKEHLNTIQQNEKKNLETIKILFSSPCVFKTKTATQWAEFFIKQKEHGAHIPSDLILSLQQVQTWRELKANPHGFFQKHHIENAYIPGEIFDLIEDKLLKLF
ncbi:hypothetical protein [uncultured Legionella sp.]|uniref:hypothetical protein n=1 Tax=uncultured Legionella sp. TaxID=210934 RepID=UPI0026346121|nr:hypothetical protein [uncultured Legionella sp.]